MNEAETISKVKNLNEAKNQLEVAIALLNNLPEWVRQKDYDKTRAETNIRSIQGRLTWIDDFLKLVVGEG